MFVLFEEDGAFKVGTLFSEADASVQIEMPSGKRTKVKRNVVLMRFTEPARDELMPRAQTLTADLDVNFLWECAPKDEFDFQDFAKEVFSEKPSAAESAALLLLLHQSPMYFYRKGRGRYRPAPEESLKAALAGAERKRLAAEAQQKLHDALLAGDMPQEIAAQALSLLIRPDKQSIVYKALDAAAYALQRTPARLLLERGALSSVYQLHYARFLHQCFPGGTGFDGASADIAAVLSAAQSVPLETASVSAVSIDDATTTEIDDAFSVTELPEGGWRVGIHIAAPGLVITPESAIGMAARERASTVYFPGEKITMLPPELISVFSLDEGKSQPALSLYVDFNAQGEKLRSQSKVERVHIEKNLRLGDWESQLDQPLESVNPDALPWPPLKTLLMLAHGLRARREEVRGKPEISGRIDFNFYVDWNESNSGASQTGDGTPRIVERRRGSPVDVLVSEFMILANTSWGDMLALARLPGVYRVQTMGRVRMQTQPGPHQGLGVNNYAWSTSPLRRYSDLLNQWQLLSVLGVHTPVYKGNEAELFSTVTQFDTLYNQYADFQETLERYWAQRWLGMMHGLGNQESWSAVDAGVSAREKAVALREGAFRLRRAPLVFRCADAPELAPGVEIEVELLACDALDLHLQAKFVSVTSTTPVVLEEEPVMLAEHYAVLGDPIAHSKSPWIHSRFAEQTDQQMQYQAHQVSPGNLFAELSRLKSEGYGGVNLTVPLKEEAFALAQAEGWELSQRTLQAGAVNTLRFDSDEFVYADNTDGVGLVRDLERVMGAAGALQDRCVLIIGAGGAAQGVIGPLKEAGVRHIRIANRNLDRAQRILDRWVQMDATSSAWLSAIPLELLSRPLSEALSWRPDPEAESSDGAVVDADDVIINATSASLSGATLTIDPTWLARASVVLDMMYGPVDTPFMQQARAAGAAKVADGLGMLVEQAAQAFALWRGVTPETASVLAQLRLQLAQSAEQ